MSLDAPMFVGYAEGDCHHTQNIPSVSWVIYTLIFHLVRSGGVSLDLNTNKIVEYSVVIELLLESISLGIQ